MKIEKTSFLTYFPPYGRVALRAMQIPIQLWILGIVLEAGPLVFPEVVLM